MTKAEMVAKMSEPDGFAEILFAPTVVHPMQLAVLRALFKSKSRVVVRNGNETGKTSRIVCGAVLYAVSRGMQVVSTASVSRQVFEQLIPALKSHAHKFDSKTWAFQDRAIKRWDDRSKTWWDAYIGFAAEDEHGFQGFHGNPDRPLLMILDEAQGIKKDIATAAEDRCNPDFMLIAGSPGDPSGFFYDCETKNAKYYSHFKLTRLDCVKSRGGWIDDADVQRMIEKHGEDNPFVRSTVFAEFSDTVEGALLTLAEYERCQNNPPAFVRGDCHAFCDFAAGRDKNVYAVRAGNRVNIRKKWQQRDTMAAVGEFVTLFNEDKRAIGLKADEVCGDADGLGLPMVQRIQEVGWQINEFHGGTSPRFEDGYRNAISEAWGELAAKIKRCEIILPADDDLKAQLLGRKCRRNSSGKLEMESKEEMKRRGLSSPDEADAVCCACLPAPQLKAGVLGAQSHWKPDWQTVTMDNQPLERDENGYRF